MTVQVRVEARVLGDRPETGIGVVELELPRQVKVADLVRVAVEEQVRTLTARRKLTAADVQQRLAHQYGPLRQQYGHPATRILVPEIDIEREVERALHAVSRGECLVVVDRRPVADLDQEITVTAGTGISFLRLMPLAGG